MPVSLPVTVDPRRFKLSLAPKTIFIDAGQTKSVRLSLAAAAGQLMLAGAEQIGVSLARIDGDLTGVALTPTTVTFTSTSVEVTLTISADASAEGSKATWELTASAVPVNTQNIPPVSFTSIFGSGILSRVRVLLEGSLQ